MINIIKNYLQIQASNFLCKIGKQTPKVGTRIKVITRVLMN